MTKNEYKDWYRQHYGKEPSVKLLEAFEKIHGTAEIIPIETEKVVGEFDFLE